MQDMDTALTLAQYIPPLLGAVAIAAVGKVARDLMCNPNGGGSVKWEAAVKVQMKRRV